MVAALHSSVRSHHLVSSAAGCLGVFSALQQLARNEAHATAGVCCRQCRRQPTPLLAGRTGDCDRRTLRTFGHRPRADGRFSSGDDDQTTARFSGVASRPDHLRLGGRQGGLRSDQRPDTVWFSILRHGGRPGGCVACGWDCGRSAWDAPARAISIQAKWESARSGSIHACQFGPPRQRYARKTS